MRSAPLLPAVAAMLALAAPAAAHIEVLPAEAERDQAVEFTVRVPTERELPTTGVRIEIPDQVTVYSFAEPPPGWTMRLVRGDDGRFRSVVYRGGSIGLSRYADFRMLGTPFGSGTAVWKARQTYADGRVKPWIAAPEAQGESTPETGPSDPGPAASVEIVAPGALAGAGAAPAAADEDESGAAIWLGVIAIAISGLSLLALGFLWSTRPATLPDDGER